MVFFSVIGLGWTTWQTTKGTILNHIKYFLLLNYIISKVSALKIKGHRKTMIKNLTRICLITGKDYSYFICYIDTRKNMKGTIYEEITFTNQTIM